MVNLVADVTHDAGADGYHVEEAQVAAAGLEAGHEYQGGGDGGQRGGLAVALDDALHAVVEVVAQHLAHVTAAQGHVAIDLGVEPEEHLQDGDDEGKREQGEERGQQVEQDVQRDVSFVGRHKPHE